MALRVLWITPPSEKQLYYESVSKDTKKKAKSRVKTLVSNGTLPSIQSQQCRVCGGPAKEYHHNDYSEFDVVVPLCVRCHRQHHYHNLLIP